MAESIAQQVRKILEKNPEITNKELYARFPKIRPNTIRHYKSGFFRKKLEQGAKGKAAGKSKAVVNGNAVAKKTVRTADKVNHISIKEKITSRAQKAAGKFQKSDLEKRVAALEKKVDQLTKSLGQVETAPVSRKSGTLAKENLDKRIKELEQSLLGFINEKRAKIKSDMSSLDELQQVMSKRITQFLATIKK